MGLTQRFTASDVRSEIQKKMERIDQAIINRLKYLGEACVNQARENGQYMNITGNLRSSVGYVVFAKGVSVAKNFEKVAQGGTDALRIAENYANHIAEMKAKDSDFVLIVVAGMEYASEVESRGKDVLTSAEQYAEQKLPGMISQLRANINKMR